LSGNIKRNGPMVRHQAVTSQITVKEQQQHEQF
jgi:hypothetical protein